jgi:hypothetical protein
VLHLCSSSDDSDSEYELFLDIEKNRPDTFITIIPIHKCPKVIGNKLKPWPQYKKRIVEVFFKVNSSEKKEVWYSMGYKGEENCTELG